MIYLFNIHLPKLKYCQLNLFRNCIHNCILYNHKLYNSWTPCIQGVHELRQPTFSVKLVHLNLVFLKQLSNNFSNNFSNN